MSVWQNGSFKITYGEGKPPELAYRPECQLSESQIQEDDLYAQRALRRILEGKDPNGFDESEKRDCTLFMRLNCTEDTRKWCASVVPGRRCLLPAPAKEEP